MEETAQKIKKTLRLTLSENKELAKKAASLKMSETQYIRLLISNDPLQHPEIKELIKQLINEINHIGVNINQIVHHHNYELYSKEDREMLLAYMRKLDMTLTEAVRAIGNK